MKKLFESWREFLEKQNLNEYVNAPIATVPTPAFGDSNAGSGINIQPQGKKFADERNEITEEKEENIFPYQIYCDMDGVLVDLIGAVLDHSQNDPSNKALRKQVENILKIEWGWTEKNPKLQKGLDYINDVVSRDVGFWTELPPMPDKNQLWSYISQYDPIVLSHPWDEDSAAGKRIWIKEVLDPQPKNVILTGDKHLHAVSKDGSPNLLIDDFEKYTIPWENAGGIAILHTSAEDTMSKLEELKESE
jgi:hypothetical protein